MKKGRVQSRRWVFTLNNYTPEEEASLKKNFHANFSYMIYGHEVAPTTGTPHLQGYMELQTKRGPKGLAKSLPGLERASLRIAKGSAEQNHVYSSKDGSVVEMGVPMFQGKRNDLKDAMLSIDRGATRNDLYVKHPSVIIRHERAILNYKRFKAVKRDFQPVIFVLYGGTGTGKSRTAMTLGRMLGSVFVVPRPKNSGLYYDGYDGEDVLIFHEMYGSTMPYATLLELTDRYPFVLPEHGSAGQQCCSRYMIFCSNKHPRDWYKGEYTQALLRRIHILWFFPEHKTSVVSKSISSASFLETKRVFFPGVVNYDRIFGPKPSPVPPTLQTTLLLNKEPSAGVK